MFFLYQVRIYLSKNYVYSFFHNLIEKLSLVDRFQRGSVLTSIHPFSFHKNDSSHRLPLEVGRNVKIEDEHEEQF